MIACKGKSLGVDTVLKAQTYLVGENIRAQIHQVQQERQGQELASANRKFSE